MLHHPASPISCSCYCFAENNMFPDYCILSHSHFHIISIYIKINILHSEICFLCISFISFLGCGVWFNFIKFVIPKAFQGFPITCSYGRQIESAAFSLRLAWWSVCLFQLKDNGRHERHRVALRQQEAFTLVPHQLPYRGEQLSLLIA